MPCEYFLLIRRQRRPCLLAIDDGLSLAGQHGGRGFTHCSCSTTENKPTWVRFSPLSIQSGNRNGTTLFARSSFVIPSFLCVSATLYMPTTLRRTTAVTCGTEKHDYFNFLCSMYARNLC